jgi:LCP family protein required for cell wall assembly
MSRLEKNATEQRYDNKKRILIITGLLLLTLVVAAAAFFGGMNDKSKQGTELSGVHKKINILLLGINQRKNDIGRSNVTCMVTVDTDTKDVSMLWVPRDSRVKIPGHGWNKIGHAYAYDGHKLSEQTVADLLGVPIDYYVAINMDGFKKVIDALGGVDINVDKRMYYYDPYDEGEVDNDGLIDLKPGMQHMDGNAALQYVRFRHDEMGDIGRIERQQKFAKALLADVISPSIITKIPNVIKEANSVFKTDMPVSEMLSVAKIITDAYKQGLKTDMVPGKPMYIDEISYWLPDVMEMRKQIAQIMGLVIDDKYLAAARSLASEYESSVPQETKVANVPAVVPKTPDHPDKQTTTSNTVTITTATSKPLQINNKPKTDNNNGSGQKVPPSSTVSGESTESVRKNTVVDTNGK